MKKLFSLAMVMIMTIALCVPAFAQEVNSNQGGSATITISNAAKGETYKIYKLFDATVADKTGAQSGEGPINYTGTIPTNLSTYFTADTAGNITATAAAMDGEKASEALQEALVAWTKTQTPTATAESDGSTLVFTGLAYGYYVITTTQKTAQADGDFKSAITVASTNPDATVYDKNETVPSGLEKKVNNDDVNFGDTVTYTVKFTTSNYDGADSTAKQIVSYTIKDTLPGFLSDVTVTGITIDGTKYTVEDKVPQFNDAKEITIPWVDDDSTSLYKNGAQVEITYTAVVTDDAAIDGNGNTNTVKLTWKTDDNTDHDGGSKTETIYTYAIALKKVNEDGQPLAGATFQFPFYVEKTPATDGAYIYAGTAAGDGLTNTLTTPADGVIVVKGVQTGTYSITETVAPDGYNKLTKAVEVTATQTGKTTTETSWSWYLDDNGNKVETATNNVVTVKYNNTALSTSAIVVVNYDGVELPSTGGMGTTIFYTVGGILMVGAAILLITKKKMANEQ